MRKPNEAGLGTIEVMVSIAILAIVASTLAHSIAAAARARVTSARAMQATESIVSLVEQLRLGDPEQPAEKYGLRYRWSTEPVPERSGLQRFSVSAAADGEQPWELRIEGLMWSPP